MQTTIKVTGMMCPHCQAHVQKALEAVEGLTDITVNLEAGTAAFSGTAVEDAIAAVKAAGYEAEIL